MAKRKRGRSKRSRVYWRNQGRERRAYGDFRDFRDVGGGREALVPRGAPHATTDRDVADKLAAERLSELEGKRRGRTLVGATGGRLEDYAAYHVEAKKRAGRATPSHLSDVEQRLRVAAEYFGPMRRLDTISVPDVEGWLGDLAKRPGNGGQALTSSTRRQYLNALSNLYRRAIGEGVVPPGYNPAAGVLEKPQPRRHEARWLEVHEAALLLESARTWEPKRPDVAAPGIHPILATFLLTGGRKSEVLGLDVEDVSFDRRKVTFRPNRHRGLKTGTSHRVVPLWPQLEHILRAWVFERDEPAAHGLLFPYRHRHNSRGKGSRVTMVGDLDKQLDAVAARAGWEPGAIRSKMFRHTYCAARLQTTDGGAPVSPYTVARELGHGGRALVDRVYGHLGEVRHRSEVVEYFVEDHRKVLGGRLEALRADHAIR